MDNTTEVQVSTQLKDQLEKLAGDYNTNIDTVIKLVLAENENLRNPDGYLTESKVSKSRNGKSQSYTYSTVIPKPIVNKFGLDKGRKLYWDINEYKIIVTPEVNPTPAPEEESIGAGYEILNDMLINENKAPYTNSFNFIREILNLKETDEDKVNFLVERYNSNKTDKDGFKKVVLYLLDYPLDLPNQYEILGEVYKEITK